MGKYRHYDKKRATNKQINTYENIQTKTSKYEHR